MHDKYPATHCAKDYQTIRKPEEHFCDYFMTCILSIMHDVLHRGG